MLKKGSSQTAVGSTHNAVPWEKFAQNKEVHNFPLDRQAYYHGILPREEINLLLKYDGDFIVRMSKKDDKEQIVISTLVSGQPKHFFILKDKQGGWTLEGASFKTINELIVYYWSNAKPLTQKSGATLRRAVPREPWELHHDDVKLLKKLGKGNFGEVYKGLMLRGPAGEKQMEVAVKMCHTTIPDEEKRKFLLEARTMRRLKHLNIVRLIGVCVQRDPIMIVIELATGGGLDEYLKKNGASIALGERFRFCVDAACGMEYLESQNVIHRDLAVRNCLLGDKNIVKISDFGMSRETPEDDGIYVLVTPKAVPIRWMAPECLTKGTFSSKSDVWSFGIMMWEIYTNADQPYPDMPANETVAKQVIKEGYRMPPPLIMPHSVGEIMGKCWNKYPNCRPTFAEIRRDFMTLNLNN